MDFSVKILVGILLALLLYVFYADVIVPYSISSSEGAVLQAQRLLAKDLAGVCKEWTDNLALTNQFPPWLEAKANAEGVDWDYCQLKWFADTSPNKDNRQRCRASCVKLLRINDRCSADPTAFGLDYRPLTNKMVDEGGATVDATRDGAVHYCVYLQIKKIRAEVMGEFPGATT